MEHNKTRDANLRNTANTRNMRNTANMRNMANTIGMNAPVVLMPQCCVQCKSDFNVWPPHYVPMHEQSSVGRLGM